MKDVVISVKHITKSFKVFFDKSYNIKERALFWKRNRYEIHQVLKDISFDVKKGEAIGLVGMNGCGKSTTLKMLSRIMVPDSGSIEMHGRVSALIELGAGFHPDMSGRENIYINAAIFGLSRKEIDSRIQSIIDFSELGAYIDNPVRTYSSGMYMRLAFSVAINVDADILLIDEILSVGDASFQAKCFHKLQEIKASGTTIVIVSHSLGQIEQICDRSIWIDQGYIRLEGRPFDVHPYYMDYMGSKNITLDKKLSPPPQKKPEKKSSALEKSATVSVESSPPAEKKPGPQPEPSESKKRWGSQDVKIERVALLNAKGEETDAVKTGDPVQIRIDYSRIDPSVTKIVLGLGIFRNDGTNCYGTNTFIDHTPEVFLRDSGTALIDIPSLNLLEGVYLLDIAFHKEDGFSYDYWRECLKFRMFSDIQDVGVSRIDHRWSFPGES